MVVTSPLALVWKSFDVPNGVMNDEITDHHSGVQVSQTRLYSITSIQPGAGVNVATEGTKTTSQTVEPISLSTNGTNFFEPVSVRSSK